MCFRVIPELEGNISMTKRLGSWSGIPRIGISTYRSSNSFVLLKAIYSLQTIGVHLQISDKILDRAVVKHSLVTAAIMSCLFLSIYLPLLSRPFPDHHIRCGVWLNFEISKRENNRAIKTIYKKLKRDMLKRIPLYQ